MPTSPEHGCSCQLLVCPSPSPSDPNFTTADEYATVASPDGRFISTYIESLTGERFAVQVSRSLEGSDNKTDVLAEIHVDGQWVPGSPYLFGTVTGKDSARERTALMEGAYADDESSSVRPFIFTTPIYRPLDDMVQGTKRRRVPSERELNMLGSVRVEFYHVKIVRRDEPQRNVRAKSPALESGVLELAGHREVDEYKQYTGRLSHVVELQGPSTSADSFEYFQHKLLTKEPFVTFIFHFRSRLVLEANGLIPAEGAENLEEQLAEGAAPSVVGTEESSEPVETQRLRERHMQVEEANKRWREIAQKAAEERKRLRREPSPVIDLTQDDD